MTILRRTTLLLIALAALAVPATALADGPVHRALTGGVIDPGATSLYIAPPKRGMVIVYRDGDAVGWFVNPGYLPVDANGVYGVVATRGSSMLFNARFRLRPGLTRLEWSDGNTPQVLYHPAYPAARHRHARPSQARPSHAGPSPSQGATPARETPKPKATAGSQKASGSGISSKRFAKLIERIEASDDDHDRYRALRADTSARSLSASQRRQVLGYFRSESMRDKALAVMGGSRARVPSKVRGLPRLTSRSQARARR